MQESLSFEHCGKLPVDALKDLLNRRAIPDKRTRHFQALGSNIADGRLHVVRDPLDKVAALLGLDLQHLVVHLTYRHPPAKDGRCREIAPMPRIASGHHVHRIKHLLCKLRDVHGTVTSSDAAGERGIPCDEKVETWEWHHVHRELSQVGIELARKPQRGGDTTHRHGDQLVEVCVVGFSEFERTEADVIEGLVVDCERLVSVLHQLVDGERCIVRLHDSVGYLGRRDDAERRHDAIGELLTELRDEERAHPRPCASSEGVGELEALETIATFRLLPYHVHDVFDHLGALRVVTLGPVIARAALSENKVVWAEYLSESP